MVPQIFYPPAVGKKLAVLQEATLAVRPLQVGFVEKPG